MEKQVLDIIIRNNPTKPEKKRLRKEGYVLGCISITREKSVHFATNLRKFNMSLKSLNEGNEFALVTEDNLEYHVYLKDLQLYPASTVICHADFQYVSSNNLHELKEAI